MSRKVESSDRVQTIAVEVAEEILSSVSYSTVRDKMIGYGLSEECVARVHNAIVSSSSVDMDDVDDRY